MSANADAGEPEADREVIITRTYDAPARLLFEAWSKPEHLKKWFGPVGYPVTMCEMDFRKGGQWRAAMTGPGGEQQTPFGGEYLEIVPDRRIVFSNGFETARCGEDDLDRHFRREGRQDAAHHPHPVRLDRPEGDPCRRRHEGGHGFGPRSAWRSSWPALKAAA